MSSLPQGWHCHADTPRKSLTSKPSEFVSSVPTLRKKWNSPRSLEKPSTASTCRKSSLTMLPNGFQSRITPPRSSAKASSSMPLKTAPMTECPPKPTVRGRDYQAEIAQLKKETATFKAENIVLKSKVRKLEDENGQKSRQVTKLKAEIQNEAVNQRRNKESETILLLRQKVLRLEGALKEKDQAIKRMVTEMNSVKVEELQSIMAKYHKQFGLSNNGLGSDFFKKHKLLQPCIGPVPSKPGQTSARDPGCRAQVDKLRNMMNKLQCENKTLLTQVKEKEQEVRRLKLQLSRQGTRILAVPRSSQSASATRLAPAVAKPATLSSRSSLSVTSVTRIPSVSQLSSVRGARTPTSTIKPSAVPKRTSLSCTTVSTSRSQSVPKQKPKSLDKQQDIERRAQIMRENIAARKIQQGWRNHRKTMSKEAPPDEEDKGLTSLASELVSHAKRQERLKFFDEDDSVPYEIPSEEERRTTQAIHNAFLSLFSYPVDCLDAVDDHRI